MLVSYLARMSSGSWKWAVVEVAACNVHGGLDGSCGDGEFHGCGDDANEFVNEGNGFWRWQKP